MHRRKTRLDTIHAARVVRTNKHVGMVLWRDSETTTILLAGSMVETVTVPNSEVRAASMRSFNEIAATRRREMGGQLPEPTYLHKAAPPVPVFIEKSRTTRGRTHTDDLAQAMANMTLDRLYQAAEAIFGEDYRARYAHLNNGQQRMNLGNRIRSLARKAPDIRTRLLTILNEHGDIVQ